MHSTKSTLSPRQREIIRRSIILMVGSLFFFIMAAVRAMSGDYYNLRQDPWFVEDDDYDVMSADDHIMAARLRQRVLGTTPLYHRQKASHMHDAVTIIVNEVTTSEIASSNDLKRDSSNDMILTNWLTPKLSGGLGTSQKGQLAGGNTPTISYTNSRAHKSDSTIERSQALSSTLTGQVIQVQPNGYLVIEAKKSVNVNGEEQTVTVTGIVNPDHMDSNSAVRAEYLIDMSVRYTGNGPMTRMDKRGWASKAIDFLNPF